MNNPYATLDEVKARLGVTGATLDAHVELAIESASRWIEQFCGRRFYAVQEARTYTAANIYLVFTDDLAEITTLKTDDDGDGVHETTWAVTDYALLPENAPASGWPYSMIEARTRIFPAGRGVVQVTGKFGFTASTDSLEAPAPIRSACLLAAIRIFKRSDVPFGISGNPQIGEQKIALPDLSADPDIVALLAPYRRLEFA
jgi:hypothetical protein